MASSKGITLYSAATPNGHKVSIALEELGLPYTLKALNLGANEQKEESFLKINPNGRIPAIVDHDNGDLAVFESGAILLYLAEKYGNGKLLPKDDRGRYNVISWLMWQMGGQGPMQGQANFFTHYFPSKQPKTVERFVKETQRLYGVLNDQLAKTEYIAGDAISIADIACVGWARSGPYAGIDIAAFPHVRRWLEAMLARPAVQKGLAAPASTMAAQVALGEAWKDPKKYEELLKEIHAKQAATE